MKYVTINDTKYRFVFSVRAISAFYESLQSQLDENGEIIEAAVEDGMQQVLNWAYTGLKFGAKADKLKFTFTKQDIEDWLDEDFESMLEIASYCRNQLKLFQQAVAGNYQPVKENGKAKEEAKKKVLS